MPTEGSTAPEVSAEPGAPGPLPPTPPLPPPPPDLPPLDLPPLDLPPLEPPPEPPPLAGTPGEPPPPRVAEPTADVAAQATSFPESPAPDPLLDAMELWKLDPAGPADPGGLDAGALAADLDALMDHLDAVDVALGHPEAGATPAQVQDPMDWFTLDQTTEPASAVAPAPVSEPVDVVPPAPPVAPAVAPLAAALSEPFVLPAPSVPPASSVPEPLPEIQPEVPAAPEAPVAIPAPAVARPVAAPPARHTKIVATLGPATSSAEAIARLITAGVDVFRLNFSHGSHEAHAAVIARIRQASADVGRVASILQDLAGPKIRTGKIAGGGIDLVEGGRLVVALGDFEGEPGRISTTYAPLVRAARPGDRLLLDDGKIELRVEHGTSTELETTVVHGGRLGQHKGINAPGAPLPPVGLTAKDAEDLRFGVEQGVDFIALSFVQNAGDVEAARAAVTLAGAPLMPLIAKLERPEAVAALDAILHAADGVMVARGDLGLELPLEQVPRVQKVITRRAREAGVPVIVATQVLESMRTASRPTRAEVSDAANAVDDGVDAIMLAGETAVGEFPVETVRTLDAVIRDAESNPSERAALLDDAHVLSGHGRALCQAAVLLAEDAGAHGLVAITHGGKTARLLSALRPRAPIFGATDQHDIANRLNLSWGVVPVVSDLRGDVETVALRIGQQLVERGQIPAGGVIAVVSIHPDLGRGRTNFLKLQRLS